MFNGAKYKIGNKVYDTVTRIEPSKSEIDILIAEYNSYGIFKKIFKSFSTLARLINLIQNNKHNKNNDN